MNKIKIVLYIQTLFPFYLFVRIKHVLLREKLHKRSFYEQEMVRKFLIIENLFYKTFKEI